MDLIICELSKLQSKSDSFEQKCHSMDTELDLMNKLLSFEHKFSQHLFDLLLKYDYYINASAKLVTNGRQTAELKTLSESKDLAVNNQIQVNQLRQELHDWRVANDRLPDPEGTDHNYNHSADRLMPAPTLAVQLEMIPKDESMSDGDEDTPERDSNSAVTAVPEVVTVNDVSGGGDGVAGSEASTSQPFAFVSQYLSQNLHFRKTYGHLMDSTAAGTSGQQNDADIDVKPIVRPVHLDNNRNSDSDDTDVMVKPTLVVTPTVKTGIMSVQVDDGVNVDQLDDIVIAKRNGKEFGFRDFRKRMKVMANQSKKGRYYVCGRHNRADCYKKYTRAIKFKEHVEKHELTFVCKHVDTNGSSCNKEYNYSSGVRKHYLKKHL